MVTLTDVDIIQLLRKNNLNQDTLQEDVVAKLSQKGLKAATAESCTGGLISERITRVSGSSAVFDCGICSYANAIKEKVLGERISGADIAVSTTGIAGPTGGTAEKPVGLVYMGVCTKDEAYAVKLMLGGAENRRNSRTYIRKLASDAALFTILSECFKSRT